MTQLYLDISLIKSNICNICRFATQMNLPCQTSKSHTQLKYILLHFDIWAHISTQFVHGHIYVLTILDDHSRFTWIICLKSKVDVLSHVKDFITIIRTQSNITPKTVKSNNGPEFIMNQFYNHNGIQHQRSRVERPQQNGRAKKTPTHTQYRKSHSLSIQTSKNSFGNMPFSMMVFL